jgi:hypothetical protein
MLASLRPSPLATPQKPNSAVADEFPDMTRRAVKQITGFFGRQGGDVTGAPPGSASMPMRPRQMRGALMPGMCPIGGRERRPASAIARELQGVVGYLPAW